MTLTDLGQARGEFPSDIQWIDPTDGLLVEEKQIEPDVKSHQEAVIVALEALLDQRSGAIEWRWLLPKFPATSIENAKELSRSQHQSLGYFRIRPAISAGAFTLGQYSALGRHLRKLQYRLGKLPTDLSGQTTLPTCSLDEPQCSTCSKRPDCIPDMEEEALPSIGNSLPTIGTVLNEIVTGARKVLSSSEWTEMLPSLGPRYGGLSSALAALTIGLRPIADKCQPLFHSSGCRQERNMHSPFLWQRHRSQARDLQSSSWRSQRLPYTHPPSQPSSEISSLYRQERPLR